MTEPTRSEQRLAKARLLVAEFQGGSVSNAWRTAYTWWRLSSCVLASPQSRLSQVEARQAWAVRLAGKRARRQSVHRGIPQKLRQGIMDIGECHYCAGPADVIDHVIPVSRGGTRMERNLVPACGWCNSQKSDMSVSEWQEWRVRNGWPRFPYGRTADELYKLGR